MKTKIYTLIFVSLALFYGRMLTAQDHTEFYPTDSIVEVSGAQSGIWQSGITFHVTGNITVATNTSLVIEPGVEVRFMGNYKFTVFGTLQAVGNQVDSIVFTTGQPFPAPNSWQYIEFLGNNSSASVISYARIEWAKYGIYSQFNATPAISHCKISKNYDFGVCCSGASPLIEDCHICFNGLSSTSFQRGGIFVTGTSALPVIRNNLINNNFRGIECKSEAIIENNVIRNNDSHGISCEIEGFPVIQHNSIFDNIGNGIYLSFSGPTIRFNTICNNDESGIFCEYSSHATIYNNVMSQNKVAGVRTAYSSAPTVFNNVMIKNLRGVFLSSAPSAVRHNLLWDNDYFSGGGLPTGFGEIVTQNLNGDPCDTYFNVFMSPEFVEYPVEGNYSWIMENDSVVFMVGNHFLWHQPYRIRLSNQTSAWSDWYEMEWNGEYFFRKFSAYLATDELIHSVEIRDNKLLFPNRIIFNPDLENNPGGPLFDPGTWNYDFQLTATSPCIDAGDPDPAYFDPDGTISDIGAFFFDQSLIAPTIIDFVADTLFGELPFTVQFTSQITGIVAEYLWYFGDGATSGLPNPFHTYELPGTYDVTLIINGQAGSDTLVKENYITVIGPVSILNPNQYNLVVFPNPSKGLIVIEGESGQAQLKIFSQSGIIVSKMDLQLPAEIDLSGIPKGIFFIRIETGENVWYKKLLRN